MVLILLALYVILLFDFKLNYRFKNHTNKIEYKGLVWVCLDYYTIKKYNSNDTPIKWVSYEKKYEEYE